MEVTILQVDFCSVCRFLNSTRSGVYSTAISSMLYSLHSRTFEMYVWYAKSWFFSQKQWLSLFLCSLPMLGYVDGGTFKSQFVQRILPTGKVVMLMWIFMCSQTFVGGIDCKSREARIGVKLSSNGYSTVRAYSSWTVPTRKVPGNPNRCEYPRRSEWQISAVEKAVAGLPWGKMNKTSF